MQIRGRGFPATATLIRTRVTVLDWCFATVAFAVVTATVLLLVLAMLCPDEYRGGRWGWGASVQ